MGGMRTTDDTGVGGPRRSFRAHLQQEGERATRLASIVRLLKEVAGAGAFPGTLTKQVPNQA